MQGAEAVHWRYSSIRGGAPAVYDADLGAHIAFFHSAVVHEANTTTLGPVRSRVVDYRNSNVR